MMFSKSTIPMRASRCAWHEARMGRALEPLRVVAIVALDAIVVRGWAAKMMALRARLCAPVPEAV